MKRFTLYMIVYLTFFLLLNATGRDGSSIPDKNLDKVITSSLDNSAQYLYVRDKTGNLRDTPKGTKINQLLQKTKVKVVEKKGDWIKVTVEGWIEEKSLTDDLLSIADKTSAGSGFYYKNVSFKSGIMNQALGEISNGSDQNYQLANFILSIYDNDEKLLDTVYINISNIPTGVTKSFQAFLLNTQINEVSSYKIQFENGF